MMNTMWWFAVFTLEYCRTSGLGNLPKPWLVSPPLVFGEWREKVGAEKQKRGVQAFG